jgi:hypothetical protein
MVRQNTLTLLSSQQGLQVPKWELLGKEYVVEETVQIDSIFLRIYIINYTGSIMIQQL